MSAELHKSLPNKARESEPALLEILRSRIAEIPWSSHITILNKVADPVARSYYNLEVEFALNTKGNPIGVAQYHLQPELPSELRGKLPSARQLANVVRPMLPPVGR